jgi:hypothetical protein
VTENFKNFCKILGTKQAPGENDLIGDLAMKCQKMWSSKGVFSSIFQQKNGFWFIILQNGTKHHVNFLAKMYPFFILDFGLKRQKSQKIKKLSPTSRKIWYFR